MNITRTIPMLLLTMLAVVFYACAENRMAQAATGADSTYPASSDTVSDSTTVTVSATVDSEPVSTRSEEPQLPYGNTSAAEMTKQMRIDRMMAEAKSIQPISQPLVLLPDVQRGFEGQTAEQIVDGLIKPELQNNKIDLDFSDLTLSDVFMTIGKASGINIMLDPDVKKFVADIHLKQVSLKEALILMASAHNLGYKRVEGSLYVTSKDKMKQQALSSRVIKLHNIKAKEAKAMIADLIKTVNISEEINTLIVIGQPDEIAKVEGVIRTIDRPQPQVVLEARIIEVNKDALKDLGFDWGEGFGISYQEVGRALTQPDTAHNDGSLLRVAGFQRSPIVLNTLIKMLETQNKAKVLSNPRVTTMNEKEAEIFVGDRFPYTVNTVAGGVTTTEVRFEEPGIRLKITPSIIEGDFVVIKVEPEVSFIYSFRGPDNQYPWIKKRNATAYVRVRNNEPFVLGGLLNQEDKKNLYKVPMLGNIPLLGNLFTRETHSLQDTELIITITPSIVQDGAGVNN